MCHRNARRDSLPFTSPRKKNGRYWHTSTRKVVLVLTTRWLQGFILSAFTVSHPSCNTVWSLKHCLTCHNALCRSSVKCLLWLWRLYLQWSQMSHDVSFVLQHVPVLTKQSNRLTVCLCVFIFDLRRLLQLTLFTAMFFSLQCVDDFYRHHPLFHAFSELLVHLCICFLSQTWKDYEEEFKVRLCNFWTLSSQLLERNHCRAAVISWFINQFINRKLLIIMQQFWWSINSLSCVKFTGSAFSKVIF